MIRGVLFDLDGTLLDSAPDLVGTLNVLRSRINLPALPVEQMQVHAARGALGLLQAGMPAAEPETLEAWREQFLSEYESRCFASSSLFEGVPAVIEHLGKASIPWGIVTNKPEFLTRPILKSAGLASSVSSLVCGDTLEERKPHPAPVLLACRQLGIAPRHVLFVGDDTRDIKAGIAAGTQTCSALYGYGSPELLKSENLDLLNNGLRIDRPMSLLNWLSPGEEQHAGT